MSGGGDDNDLSAVAWPGFVDILSSVLIMFVFFVMIIALALYNHMLIYKAKIITDIKKQVQGEDTADTDGAKDIASYKAPSDVMTPEQSKAMGKDAKAQIKAEVAPEDLVPDKKSADAAAEAESESEAKSSAAAESESQEEQTSQAVAETVATLEQQLEQLKEEKEALERIVSEYKQEFYQARAQFEESKDQTLKQIPEEHAVVVFFGRESISLTPESKEVLERIITKYEEENPGKKVTAKLESSLNPGFAFENSARQISVARMFNVRNVFLDKEFPANEIKPNLVAGYEIDANYNWVKVIFEISE